MGDQQVARLRSLHSATASDLSFLSHPKYQNQLAQTQAAGQEASLDDLLGRGRVIVARATRIAGGVGLLGATRIKLLRFRGGFRDQVAGEVPPPGRLLQQLPLEGVARPRPHQVQPQRVHQVGTDPLGRRMGWQDG